MLKNKQAKGLALSNLPTGLQIIVVLGIGVVALVIFGISMYLLYLQLFG